MVNLARPILMAAAAVPRTAAAAAALDTHVDMMAAAGTAAGRPHVLFVVIDDLGFDDVGFRSGDIRTPHIDALAEEGVVLDQYYAQDVCSPSRASFMTGRYAMHHSIVDWIPPASAYGLPLNLTTMADVFKGAGYETRAVGKWHLGFYQEAFTPTFRGFDSFVGFYSGGEDYFTHVSSGGYDFRNDSAPHCGANCSVVAWESQGRYSTTVFAEEAVRVIENYDTSQAEEHPLFMYLAFQGVHAPAEAPQSYIDAYNTSIADPKRRTFAGMLSCVDEGIGNVTAALAAKGMTNTVVVFTADNGGPTTTGDGVGARNWPLRGGKHSIWEGGVRVTGLVSGPAIRPSAAGKTYSGLMHAADWLPTLLTATNVPLPANDSGLANLDGVSQWEAINAAGAGADGSAVAPPRSHLVIGNSTNDCSWGEAGTDGRGSHITGHDHRRDGGPNGNPGCGFSVVMDYQGGLYKAIQGYGGAPDTWCNTSKGNNSCYTPPTTTAAAAAAAAPHITHHPTVVAETAGCTVVQGVCFPGNDIRRFNSSDTAECCTQCQAQAGCVAWTHNKGECFLKSKAADISQDSGCTSGNDGKTPLPPTPAPPSPGRGTCPDGWCLYNVRQDPIEQHEISSSEQDILAMLQTDMANVLESYWQYAPDPSCPPHKFPDPNKPVWGPWC